MDKEDYINSIPIWFERGIKMNERNEMYPIAYDPGTMEWMEVYDEHMKQTIYDKRLVSSEEDGIMINVSKYPAGYYKTYHKHSCGHGIYVLKGKLRTEEGIYGPGSFVWHPEGCVARHGATDEEDCEFLFITNKPFDIIYD